MGVCTDSAAAAAAGEAVGASQESGRRPRGRAVTGPCAAKSGAEQKRQFLLRMSLMRGQELLILLNQRLGTHLFTINVSQNGKTHEGLRLTEV